VAHLQNALDLLEPLSMEVKGEYLGQTEGGRFFRQKFSGLASGFYHKLLEDKDNPDRDVRRQIGRAFHGLGMSHAVLNEGKQAEEALRDAVAIQEKLLDEFPSEEDYRVDLALSYHNLGDIYAARDDKERAGNFHAKIVPLFQALPRNNGRMPLFAYKLASKLWALGKSQEAFDWLNRLINQLDPLMKDEMLPEQKQQAALTLALAYYTRALLLVEQDKPAHAVSDFDRALGVKEAKLPSAIADDCRQRRALIMLEMEFKKPPNAPAK
jgi:tetratricopeptide (TPR) repeat protein